MKEIKERILALEKMLGKNSEYDKGLAEGISALEDIDKIVDIQLDYLRGVAIGKEKIIRGMERAYRIEYFNDDTILEDDNEFKKWLENLDTQSRGLQEYYYG